MLNSLSITVVILVGGGTFGAATVRAEVPSRESPFDWQSLPPLPNPAGFAGSFAGVHNGALIIAGGTNFPKKKPWEGGAKVWYDSAFVLEKADGDWKTGEKLPAPRGYGVSLTTPDGVACIGGSDANRHYGDCYLLRWQDSQLKATPLPALPKPCANQSGALVGDTIYVAGGIEQPQATTALKTLWSLDLNKLAAGWRELDPIPGPGRMMAVAGSQGGVFYLFGGSALKPGADEKPQREQLRDCYCYAPTTGWRRLADLPRSSVAAPTPAPTLGQSRLLFLGGDDGSQATTLPAEHRGFPRTILAYHTTTDTWATLGKLPFSLVTTPTAVWRDQIIIPGGERRPGVRSNEVWAATVVHNRAP